MLNQFKEIIKSIRTDSSILLPSEFAEKNRVLTSDVSTQQGAFRYSGTPYLREIVDTLSPYHPAKIIGVMKGAQIGFTEGVIVNGILWMIANNPGNCLTLSANDELSKEIIESRLDQGIASCGISHLIRPNTIRKRNARTGDTSKSKEYAGGRLFAGGVNSIDKLAKQRSIKYGFFDDWDAALISDKDQGNLFELIQQRFSTSAKSMKQYFISTPETKPSNIEIVYNMGDKRKWMVRCPLCGRRIEILFLHDEIEKPEIGIVFDKDKEGKIIDDSVRYICQECNKSFKENHKYDMNLKGEWIPTAKPLRPWIYSYYVPCFISAPWMYNWIDYVHKWSGIFNGENVSQSKRKVFINQVMVHIQIT
jgi:phage terminase large subunit GpA-like protein